MPKSLEAVLLASVPIISEVSWVTV